MTSRFMVLGSPATQIAPNLYRYADGSTVEFEPGTTVSPEIIAGAARAWERIEADMPAMVALARPILQERDYRSDRDAARAARKGETLYPRLVVWGSTWVRQDYAGGPFTVVENRDAATLLLGEVAA